MPYHVYEGRAPRPGQKWIYKMSQAQDFSPITSSLITEEARLTFLPKMFLNRFMRGEALVYAWLSKLSPDYQGAYWDFYSLSNGSFYMAPRLDHSLHLTVGGNWFDADLSADASGIVATLYSLCQLTSEMEGTDVGDVLIERYHSLRDFVRHHPEADLIYAAID